MAIVIVFDFLHQFFDTIILSLLETVDRIIDKIQRILQFKEAKKLNKQATGNIGDLVIVFRDKSVSSKKKITSNDEYYNCHKFGNFG